MLATEKEFLYSRLQFLIEKYSSWMKMKDPQENDEHFGNLHEIRQDMEKLKEYLESVPAETLVMPKIAEIYICKIKILGFGFAVLTKHEAENWVKKDPESNYYDIVKVESNFTV